MRQPLLPSGATISSWLVTRSRSKPKLPGFRSLHGIRSPGIKLYFRKPGRPRRAKEESDERACVWTIMSVKSTTRICQRVSTHLGFYMTRPKPVMPRNQGRKPPGLSIGLGDRNRTPCHWMPLSVDSWNNAASFPFSRLIGTRMDTQPSLSCR